MRLAADLFLLLGAAFALLGALGLLRMPDVYNRIQAGTKAVTLGALSFLIGVGLLHPEWWTKLLCIAGFILFTNPVGSSTIARALYLSGVRPWRAVEEKGADPSSQR
ncbi:MAG: monovalent cation/H(+) antiporter subunit G [Pseudomonadota bacterium]|nr:monovalent cation/H(+) antiporter subunit G [Pseudomonadota bacterium]